MIRFQKNLNSAARLCIAVLLLILLALLWRHFSAAFCSPLQVHRFVARAGIWGPCAFIALHIFAPLAFFPASLLALAALLAWNWKIALIYVTIGSNLCSNLMFFLGRMIGQGRVQRLVRGRAREAE